MDYPKFYLQERVGTIYQPDVAGAVECGLETQYAPAHQDDPRILLLLIDAQVDFIHADGALSVPGAVEDTRRTIEWLFRNAGRVSAVIASLDSHTPTQIFFPTWWVDSQGGHPDAFTSISSEDLEAGRWMPIHEEEWSRNYARKLEERAKKALMIWPYHTMLGTPGHALTPALYEALIYHAAARRTTPEFVIKGSIAKTEYYSILEPEIKVPDDPQGVFNEALLRRILGFDAVYVAGQAKSHCVLETLASIVRRCEEQPEVLGKIHLLTDCTSSVQHPDVDFEALAGETYARFAAQGLKLTRSTDALA